MKFIILMIFLIKSVYNFNVDVSVKSYMTDPDPTIKPNTTTNTSSPLPHFFGNTIKFVPKTKHFVVSSGGNSKYTGKVFSCGSNDDCRDMSPSTDMTKGQPLDGLVVSVDTNTGGVTACLPLMEKKCNGHIHSLGFCFNREDDVKPWNMVQEKQCAPPVEKISMMFTIDGSRSLGKEHFESVKTWMSDISTHLNFTMTDLGVVQFSKFTTTTVQIPLGKYTTPETFKAAVMALEYQDQTSTFTSRGIYKTMEELRKTENETNHERVMLLLTDGRSSDTTTNLKKELDKLQELDVTSIAVGVGNAVDQEELKLIASNPENVYKLGAFADLAKVIDPIINTITPVQGEGTVESTGLRLIQKGFSSSHLNGRLLLGAVGAYDWSGTVAKYDNAADKEADIPDYNEVQKVLKNRTKESYLGYSVTTGQYNQGSDYVASGAPRYYMRGAVVVYKPVDGSKTFDDATTIHPYGSRRQFGSYYGGTLLSMDVNNDGKDDLLVAAPLYIANESDEGRVFVYVTKRGVADNVKRWEKETYVPVELKGNSESGARFGTAMANAGDLNKDGYNDVVIGAPLTQDGKGAVYVYHGSRNGVIDTPVQRIAASDVSGAKLQYFGQSLQGGVDLDGNSYPDVAVGAPRSDTIAIFRSRPVLKFDSSIDFTYKKIAVFDCLDTPNRQCQNITYCITTSGEGIEEHATANIKILLDPEFGRLQFRETPDSSSGVKEKSIENVRLNANEKHCWPETTYFKDKIENYNDPVTAKLEYQLTDAHKAIPLSSISDPSKPHEVENSMDFQKNCLEKVCEIDLQVESKVTVPDSELKIVGQIKPTDLTNGKTRLVVDKDTNGALELSVNVTNYKQSAFDAQVIVTYSNQLSWNEITDVMSSNAHYDTCMQDKGKDVIRGVDSNSKSLQYEYDEKRGNIMPQHSWCSFKIKLTWDKLKNANLPKVLVKLEANTLNRQNDSVDIKPDNNMVKFDIPVVYRSDVDGKRKGGESTVKFNVTTGNTTINNVNEIGKNTGDVVIQYELTGRGFANIPKSSFSLQYPEMYNNEYYLLYLYGISCQALSSSSAEKVTKCTCDESRVNKLGLENRFTSENDTTNNATLVSNPKPFMFSEIDCNNKTTADSMCASLNCQVDNLGESQKVIIQAFFRIWTPTFHFVFNKTEKTVMKVNFDYNTEESKYMVYKTGKNVTYYKSEHEVSVELYRTPTEIPQNNQIWIYIVAGIGGLLLLLIAVFILYKCGFFESKYAQKKEELEWQEADGGGAEET